MRDKLLDATQGHLLSLNTLQSKITQYSGSQIQAGALLIDIKRVALAWFENVKPTLTKAGFSSDTITKYSALFELMLKQSRIKPSKKTVHDNLAGILQTYSDDIIHQIEIGSFSTPDALSITPFIEGLEGVEREYLDEAQRCLAADALRGCIVMGWCAVISRIHAKIEEVGFEKFSKSTSEMKVKTTGRFRPFKKEFQVDSLSDLQQVFDTDILWVLEYWQLIDGNQHQRLRSCFEMRNHSAHPGKAPIKGPNLYSFYSDISEIVLKNDKFAVASTPVVVDP